MYNKPRVFVADFETTVTGENKEQKSTEVWATALVEMFDEEVNVRNCISSFFADLFSYNSNLVVYFHNLKFDGSFILDYLLKKDYKPALDKYNKWCDDKYMSKKSFKTTITDRGVWYTITVKTPFGKTITFKDSLKLLPFSVAQIGKAFETKHRKLTMEYVGSMQAGGDITEEQKEYIRNDVLVVKEALEIMFNDGLDKLTIGACCKDQYKKSIMETDYNNWFPSLTKIYVDKEQFGSENADEYIRKSYKGGWCYLKKGCENKVFYNGSTADVNSLYPSMMLDKDYPVGKPTFWSGDFIPEEATKPNRCYFIRVKTSFQIKDKHLPTIQIKDNFLYRGNEWLETSSVKNPTTGVVYDNPVVLTLTQMDWELMQEHYHLWNTEIFDGCWFWTMQGKLLFGEYINKWAEVKKKNKGAKRTQAKLFLNNLYGKFSAKKDNSTKLPYIDDEKQDEIVHFANIDDEDEKKIWYIPIGSYVTSHARNFTIKAAQANYDDFIYGDTDSIHCDCEPSEIKGIKVHKTEFSCWDLESTWDVGIFVRQKTYIEHVIEEELEPCEPYYNIKCAGMDKRPKELLRANLERKEIETKSEEEKIFMNTPLDITDFKVGIKVPGSLKPRRIKGGILLVSDYYTMRDLV